MLSPRKRRRSLLLAFALVLVSAGLTHRSAIGQTTNSIKLVWTAPGDDGTIGRATRYDLRYRASAISSTDTLAWWNAATIVNLSGKVPSASGALDSVTVSGLTPGVRYYVILRAADEVPNWSSYSNVATFLLSDNTPPRQIVDLIAR